MKKLTIVLFIGAAIVLNCINVSATQFTFTKIGEYDYINTKQISPGVHLEGTTLYTGWTGTNASGTYGNYLEILDVSDPYNIQEISELLVTTTPHAEISEIKKYENYLITANARFSSSVIDVTDNAAPDLKNTISFGHAVTSAVVIDSTHYMLGSQ